MYGFLGRRKKDLIFFLKETMKILIQIRKKGVKFEKNISEKNVSTLTVSNYTLKHFDLRAKEYMDTYLKVVNADISDYTFAGNYIWLSTATGFYAIVNDTFCLFILNSSELSMLLPALGKEENTYEAMLQCFEIMNAHNSNKKYSKIEYIHENLLEGFVDYLEEGTVIFDMLKHFIIEKKLVDYIYKTDHLIYDKFFHADRCT